MPRIKSFLLILFAIQVFMSSCRNKRREDRIPLIQLAQLTSSNPEIAALTEDLEDSPENADLYFKRARLYLAAGNTQAALKDAKHSIELNKEEPAYYSLLARVYKTMNVTDASLQAATRAEALGANEPELLILLSELYAKQGNAQKSEEYLNRASSLAPYHTGLYLLKGKLAQSKGDTATAFTNYYEALRKDSGNVEIYKELIKLLDRKKKQDSAVVYIVKGRALSPGDPFFTYYEGRILERMGMAKGAETSYLVSLKYDSSYSPAYQSLGEMKYKNSDYISALKYYSKILVTDPNNKQANLSIGDIYYEKLNQGQNAINYYQTALRSDSGNVKLKKNLEALYKLYPDRRVVAKADSLKKVDSLRAVAKKDSIKNAKLPKKDTVGKGKTTPVKPNTGTGTTNTGTKPGSTGNKGNTSAGNTQTRPQQEKREEPQETPGDTGGRFRKAPSLIKKSEETSKDTAK